MRLYRSRWWLLVIVMLVCRPMPVHGQATSKKEKLNEALADAVENNKIAKVRELLAQGADPDTISLEAPVLLTAANSGYLSVAQLLLDKGAHIHKAASNGNEPLAAAVLQGNMVMVQMLMKRGATLEEAETGIGHCAMEGHTDMLKYMLDKGIKVDALGNPTFNTGGMTPLAFAAMGGQLETARFLISRGADVNALDKEKETPLMMALSGLDSEDPKVIAQIVTLLLAKGAKVDVTSETESPHTALSLARAKKLTAVVKLLQDAGAKK